MPYLLGYIESGTKARVNLIYNEMPPQNVIDSYDINIQVAEKPVASQITVKSSILYVDTQTNEAYYEYVDRPLTEEEIQAEKISKIAQISTKDKVLEGSLKDEEMVMLAGLYPAWEVGVAYAIDDVISYKGELYKVIQAHTSQADWAPDIVTSLYTNVMPAGVTAEWRQPTGAHDSYMLGEQVTHNNSLWESTINDNVWEPGVYGWVEVE